MWRGGDHSSAPSTAAQTDNWLPYQMAISIDAADGAGKDKAKSVVVAELDAKHRPEEDKESSSTPGATAATVQGGSTHLYRLMAVVLRCFDVTDTAQRQPHFVGHFLSFLLVCLVLIPLCAVRRCFSTVCCPSSTVVSAAIDRLTAMQTA